MDGAVVSAPSSSSSAAISVVYINKRRGRGVMAGRQLAAQTPILAVRPDIAVLYSTHAGRCCAECFAPCQQSAPGCYHCPTCDQFVLCRRCVQLLHSEATADHNHGHPITAWEAGRLDVPWVLRVHQLACAWYNELPAAVRAPGQDTDFLRFCLLYGARVALGDITLRRSVDTLDANAAAQSAESHHFCEVFARDRIVATFGGPGPVPRDGRGGVDDAVCRNSAVPRYPVDAEHLRGVLLRTRCNSLGFPFNASETMGWALQKTLCMLNHSCAPNAAVVMAESDDDFVRTAGQHDALRGCIGLKAIRNIVPGEEITISYLDLDVFGDLVQERQRHLLEQYRFLCTCQRCSEQRQQLKKMAGGTGAGASS